VKRIPHAQNVAKALRSVRLATQKALKGMNQLASQRMARGDYTGAEVLASKAKGIMQFQAEVDVVHKRWREVCGSGDRAARRSQSHLYGLTTSLSLRPLFMLAAKPVEWTSKRTFTASWLTGCIPRTTRRWRGAMSAGKLCCDEAAKLS
jgi:hypothetical protein